MQVRCYRFQLLQPHRKEIPRLHNFFRRMASTKRVLVPIANGSEEIESVGIIDTLRRAGADVTVASVEDRLQVLSILVSAGLSSCC